jgi:exonuclease SbcD
MRNNSFSFIHTADLHLDSPFECIQAEDPKIANMLRNATFRAFENVINLAIQKGVDFLIVAGDVYDGLDRSLRAQWQFYQMLRRAAEAGIQCFVAHGNHDPLSGWEAGLAVPNGVHRFHGDDVQRIAVKRDGQELAYIYGISYPSREINESLTPRFSRKNSKDNSPFAIGVLHCNVGGAPEHDNYAPCTMDDLTACGMDYWALGHIHSRKVLRESEPCIIYPGNTQGRSVRELGERGCYLVRVDETGHVDAEFMTTDVVRWFMEDISITDMPTLDTLMNVLADRCTELRSRAVGRDVVVRIYLTGRGELHRILKHQRQELVSVLREAEAEQEQRVWVESLHDHTRPAVDVQRRREVEDFIGEFLRVADRLRERPDTASEIRQLLTEPDEHSIIADQIDMLTEEELLSILEDAETLGLDWLLEGRD